MYNGRDRQNFFTIALTDLNYIKIVDGLPGK